MERHRRRWSGAACRPCRESVSRAQTSPAHFGRHKCTAGRRRGHAPWLSCLKLQLNPQSAAEGLRWTPRPPRLQEPKASRRTASAVCVTREQPAVRTRLRGLATGGSSRSIIVDGGVMRSTWVRRLELQRRLPCHPAAQRAAGQLRRDTPTGWRVRRGGPCPRPSSPQLPQRRPVAWLWYHSLRSL